MAVNHLHIICEIIQGNCPDWPDQFTVDDLESLIKLSEAHQVIALLSNHTEKLKHHNWPSSFINAIAIANKTAQTIEHSRRKKLIQLCQLFDSNQINPLLFKGAANAYLLYEHPHQRLHADIDLLIDVEQFDLVKQTLISMEFQLDPIEPGEYGPFQTSARLKQSAQPELILDIHWKINNRLALADTLDFNHLSKHAIPLPVYGETAQSVSLSDALLIAAIHDAGALASEQGKLIGLYDAHLLINQLDVPSLEKTMAMALKLGIGQILISYLSSAVNLFNEKEQDQVKSLEQQFPVSEKELSAELLNQNRSRFKDHYLDYRAVNSPWSKLRFIVDKFKRKL